MENNTKESESAKQDRYMADFILENAGVLDVETIYDGRWVSFMSSNTQRYWQEYKKQRAINERGYKVG